MQFITNSSAIMPGMMQFSYFYGNVYAGLKKGRPEIRPQFRAVIHPLLNGMLLAH